MINLRSTKGLYKGPAEAITSKQCYVNRRSACLIVEHDLKVLEKLWNDKGN